MTADGGSTVQITIPFEEDDLAESGLDAAQIEALRFEKDGAMVLTVRLTDGMILGWPPHGGECRLNVKVGTRGAYKLLSGDGRVVAAVPADRYVPNDVVPGRWGDYVDLRIARDGTIKNWPSDPSFDDFEIVSS